VGGGRFRDMDLEAGTGWQEYKFKDTTNNRN
jgi:hypothetical protein